MKKCLVESCERRAENGTYCWLHYNRLRTHGTTNRPHPLFIKEDFWSFIRKGHPDECWDWLANTNQKGYGYFKMSQKQIYAHRHVWYLINGAIPDGFIICHTCDNPSCCNPNHMFIGTVADNNADKIRKGRHKSPKGETHPRARHTNGIILEIRQLSADGMSNAEISRRFNIRDSKISEIVKRKVWKHI